MQTKKPHFACALMMLLAGACRPGLSQRTGAENRERELAGIEKLHQQDIAATLSDDPSALAELWADDAVRLEPGRQADVGKPATRASERAMADRLKAKVARAVIIVSASEADQLDQYSTSYLG